MMPGPLPTSYSDALASYMAQMGVQHPTAIGAAPSAPVIATQPGSPGQALVSAAIKAKLAKDALASATATNAAATATNPLVLTSGGNNAMMGQVLTSGGDNALMGTASAAQPTTISNFAGSATPYLGAAGTALGAYGAYQGIKNQNPLTAALSGAGAGLGLNAMGYALGPWGWAAMAGVPAIAALAGKLGDKNEFQGEYKRAQKLRDQGLNWDFNPTKPSKGRSKQQLIAEALATGGNVEFAKTRDENLLTGKDLAGYSFLPEKFGSAYANADINKKIGAAQLVADAKAVREAKGQMDFNQNMTADLEQKIKDYLGATDANKKK